MNCLDILRNWKGRNQALQARLDRATRDMSDGALQRRPEANTWSPAEVVGHMVLAHRPYLKTIQDGMERADRDAGDPPIRHSLFGKMLIKINSPDANTPAPRALHPVQTLVWQEVFAEWQRQHSQLLSLIDRAAGVDLSGVSVRSPFIGSIRQNLADCFEIVTIHTERHVGQIEQRVLRNCGIP